MTEGEKQYELEMRKLESTRDKEAQREEKVNMNIFVILFANSYCPIVTFLISYYGGTLTLALTLALALECVVVVIMQRERNKVGLDPENGLERFLKEALDTDDVSYIE